MIRWIWIIVSIGIAEAWRKRNLDELRTTWALLTRVRPWESSQ